MPETAKVRSMLVLSRKLNERVVIGANVTVTVVDIRGDRVKLAFDAPNEVPIHREEVHRRIQLEERDEEKLRESNESPYYSQFA